MLYYIKRLHCTAKTALHNKYCIYPAVNHSHTGECRKTGYSPAHSLKETSHGSLTLCRRTNYISECRQRLHSTQMRCQERPGSGDGSRHYAGHSRRLGACAGRRLEGGRQIRPPVFRGEIRRDPSGHGLRHREISWFRSDQRRGAEVCPPHCGEIRKGHAGCDRGKSGCVDRGGRHRQSAGGADQEELGRAEGDQEYHAFSAGA